MLGAVIPSREGFLSIIFGAGMVIIHSRSGPPELIQGERDFFEERCSPKVLFKRMPLAVRFGLSLPDIRYEKPAPLDPGALPYGVFHIRLPMWLPQVFLGALLACAVYLRRRDALANECSVCLYNLIGTISCVCPECGTPIPEEQSNAIAEAAKATVDGDAPPATGD